jgi:hypothetical protein
VLTRRYKRRAAAGFSPLLARCLFALLDYLLQVVL